MRSQIESGAELLARLNGKSTSLYGLDDNLFLKGPRDTDVVEISGHGSTGKTLLLSQMLAKCILPNRSGSVRRINGCDASAILINTDHHFQVSKMIQLMTDIVDTAARDTNSDDIVRNSLQNLRIVDCYDSEQFLSSLRTLEDLFIGNPAIALLAIDSVTAYYWQDRENNATTTIDSYVRKLIKYVRTQTTRFNVATIYTRSRRRENDAIDRKGKVKTATNLVERIADYQVRLHRTHDSQGSADILEDRYSLQLRRRLRYSISSNGIKWKICEGEGYAI
ncbi:X-ray repair cross complementing 2 [Calliopsis andreniformis]|uniref:X-ray repair cross complementing 2 n=1 Tax=Calliopsis andreniformis TaxID=337506 RepID=UPI003FCD03CC